ncbi:MAG TPA: ATP-binding protein [Methylomirabilota bacterium]|nr:ATP-binding protein [Methylomirabilota bacterium]
MLSRFSLRTIFVVGVLLAGAIVATVIGIGSASAIRRLTIAQTLERHEELARRLAAESDQFLSLHLQAVRMVAAFAAVQTALDTNNVSSMLLRTRESYPALASLGVVDRNGRLVVADLSTSPGADGSPGDDLSKRAWWREMLLSRRPVVDKSVEPSLPQAPPTVALAAPIIDSRGEVGGAVTGALDLAFVQSLAAGFQLGRTGQASVASADGVRFAHLDLPTVGPDLSRDSLWALMTADSGRIASYADPTGPERLAGFATVRPAGWKVWVSQETAEVDEEIARAFVGVLPWVLVALTGLGTVAVALALFTALPVRAVEAAATAIAAGDVTGHAPEQGPREMVGLARSFNRMVAVLRRRLAVERETKAAVDQALREYGALAARVADGDLTARVTPAEQPELRELGWNLNRMATALQRHVETLHRATASEAAARAESERRRREMQTANRRIVQVLDSITDGFMTLDQAWRVVYVNRRAEETIGRLRRSPDGLIGKVLWEEFPDLVGSMIQREFERAARDGVPVQFEFFYPPLGAWFELRGYPSPEGLAVYFHDVSDRKRGEESLRESEERLRMAVEAGRMGTWEWRIDTGRVSWSPGLEAIHGLAPGAFPGTFDAVQREIHPEDRDRVLQTIHESVEHRKDLRLEYRIIRADGTVRWLEGRGRLVGERHGRPERVVGVCMDITDRKRAEEERGVVLAGEQKARAEAEAANQARDEFLAVLSHELRTPLNAILGWSRMLRFGSLDPATVERAIETIGRNAQLQTQLIDDLLDVSRIVSGKMQIERRRVELPAVLQAAVEGVRAMAEVKGVRLEHATDANAVAVSGDAFRLQQIFGNLLDNAIKFTPAGGRVQITLERRASWVEIRVSDTGSGIAPALLPHIFERFRLGDAKTTREHGGLGLGLAIVRHLVELHGGAVRADSAGEGRGSMVTVRLPLAADPAPPREAASPPIALPPEAPALLHGIDVLVVDDDADGRELLSTTLVRAGAWVRAVSSAGEALAEMDIRVPEVLVSDLAMPGKDGYALIRQVRSRSSERQRRLPAVAVSAHAREEDRRRALEAGYDVHIAKPIDPAEFAGLIGRLVNAGHSRPAPARVDSGGE